VGAPRWMLGATGRWRSTGATHVGWETTRLACEPGRWGSTRPHRVAGVALWMVSVRARGRAEAAGRWWAAVVPGGRGGSRSGGGGGGPAGVGRRAAGRAESRWGRGGGGVLWGGVDSRVWVVAAPNTVAGRVRVVAAPKAIAGPKVAGPGVGRTGADGGGPAEGTRHCPGVLRVRAVQPAPRHAARPRVRPAFVPRPSAGRVPPRPCAWPRRAAPCVLRKGRPTPP